MVELMVVVALLSIIMVTVVGLFLMTLKNGGKAAAMAKVKEEGDYAITNIERQLRFAQSVSINSSNNNICGQSNQIFYIDTQDIPLKHQIKVNADKQLIIIDDFDGVKSERQLTSTGNSGVTVEPAAPTILTCVKGNGRVGDMVMFSANFKSRADDSVSQVFSTRVVLRNH